MYRYRCWEINITNMFLYVIGGKAVCPLGITSVVPAFPLGQHYAQPHRKFRMEISSLKSLTKTLSTNILLKRITNN